MLSWIEVELGFDKILSKPQLKTTEPQPNYSWRFRVGQYCQAQPQLQPQPKVKFADCSLHIVVCILQFAHCSLHITVCLNLNFESETECGIESETESGSQYENVWIPKTEIQSRIECETETGTESGTESQIQSHINSESETESETGTNFCVADETNIIKFTLHPKF